MSWADELRPLRITISTLASECAGTWRACRADEVSRRRSIAHVGLRVVQRLAYGAGWAAGGLTSVAEQPATEARVGRLRAFRETVVSAGGTVVVHGVIDDGGLCLTIDSRKVEIPAACRISDNEVLVEEHVSRAEMDVIEVHVGQHGETVIDVMGAINVRLRFLRDGTFAEARGHTDEVALAFVLREQHRSSARIPSADAAE